MPAPNDLNSRIAKAKGWTRDEGLHICSADRGYAPSHWRDPKGIPAPRPDFVGTLDGVAGMLWELGDWEWLPMTKERAWYLPVRDQITENWICLPHQCVRPIFISSLGRPGDCVGEAWLSVFGKEENK